MPFCETGTERSVEVYRGKNLPPPLLNVTNIVWTHHLSRQTAWKPTIIYTIKLSFECGNNSYIVFHIFNPPGIVLTAFFFYLEIGNCPSYSNSWCGNLGTLNYLYYGRGWFQLTYPCNYYYAGAALAVNLLHNPDLVANDPNLSVTTALWFYTANNMNTPAQQGNFAATTKIINGALECNHGSEYNNQVTRVQTYIRIAKCFGFVPNNATLYC